MEEEELLEEEMEVIEGELVTIEEPYECTNTDIEGLALLLETEIRKNRLMRMELEKVYVTIEMAISQLDEVATNYSMIKEIAEGKMKFEGIDQSTMTMHWKRR